MHSSLLAGTLSDALLGASSAMIAGFADGVLDEVLDFLIPDHWSLQSVYLGCAVIGGAILVLQLGLLMLGGIGGDVDFDGDTDFDGDAGEGLSYLSIRALAGFLTFFGLTGLAGHNAGWSNWVTMLASLGAGLAMFVLVAWIMSLYKRLSSSGNLDPNNAIGKSAMVYLRIPASRAGQGKITVTVQGRELQFQAVTDSEEELPTGREVEVVALVSAETFAVRPLGAAAGPEPE